MGENILSEFEGDNWAKSASGNVASQALSTCLAESQFKRCATQQTVLFSICLNLVAFNCTLS
jgi:hypothetical protein